MLTPSRIQRQMNDVVRCLVEVGLCDDQNFSFMRTLANERTEVTFQNAGIVATAMKAKPYKEIYKDLASSRAFCTKMLDGALVQMMYMFNGNALEQHRLAFFPSPSLPRFEDAPDVYEEDELYADIVATEIVPFPIRFDFNVSDEVHEEIHHSRAHLSLGQYENCRIPVTAPLTPFGFIDFLLRHFYHRLFRRHAERLPRTDERFVDCISTGEKGVIHLTIPAGG